MKAFLKNHFSASRICPFANKDDENCEPKLNVEPDLEDIFRTSRNHEELLYYWRRWREVAGNEEAKEKYLEQVNISNHIARLSGFADKSESLKDAYKVDNLKDVVLKIWREEHNVGGRHVSLEGLYKHLHAYVRHKLAAFYNPQVLFISCSCLMFINSLHDCFSFFMLYNSLDFVFFFLFKHMKHLYLPSLLIS